MKHYEGLNQALANVRNMNRDQLISQLRALYGFQYLFETLGLPIAQLDDETLREEALRQTEIEFRQQDCKPL